jgi:hypothetical protein
VKSLVALALERQHADLLARAKEIIEPTPRKPPKRCAEAGCRNVVSKRGQRCGEHRKTRRAK